MLFGHTVQPVKLCVWMVPRPSRPEDLVLLAEVRQQVQEQEALALMDGGA